MINRSTTRKPAALKLARALALAVLAVPHGWAAAQSGDAGMQPESVMTFQATGQELVFRVPTGGCTTVADFHVGVQRSGRDVSLVLDRLRADTCKGRFPAGIELSIPYDDVGLRAGDRISLVNSIAP